MYGIIYLLTSPSGKHYVGQTTQPFVARWNYHARHAGADFGCRYLYNALCKYGPDSFEKDIIAECPDKVELDRLERFWIKMLQSNNPLYGYNIAEGGANGKHSEETKQLMSAAQSGKVLSGEHRKKLSLVRAGPGNGMFGKQQSEEAKAKISEFQTGRQRSEETKQKMSVAHSGENNPMFGRKHTKEQLKKISDASWLRHHFKEIAWG